jgi:hypothetical protein
MNTLEMLSNKEQQLPQQSEFRFRYAPEDAPRFAGLHNHGYLETLEEKPDSVNRTKSVNLVAAGVSRPEKKKKLTSKS